jgi:hypothetical protein
MHWLRRYDRSLMLTSCSIPQLPGPLQCLHLNWITHSTSYLSAELKDCFSSPTPSTLNFKSLASLQLLLMERIIIVKGKKKSFLANNLQPSASANETPLWCLIEDNLNPFMVTVLSSWNIYAILVKCTQYS